MIDLPTRYASVTKVLDGGGMSDTLLCQDSHLNRPVVIKRLKTGIEKHRLLDELSALSSIRSRYVVQVLDVISHEGEIVGLVEEYIDGDDLAPLTHPSSRMDILAALYPIFAGVAEIHSHERLHRDLKPDNMKLDSGGVLKVFDFGLAKIAQNAKTNKLFFSQGYAAPEIFQVDALGQHCFSKAVDVFAAGAISLWMLQNGILPPQLSSIPPQLPCVDFSKLGVPLSARVSHMLNLTLSINPDDRPTAEEVRVVLERELLFDRHKMLLTYSGASHILSAQKRSVELTSGPNSIKISYDGYSFSVSSVTGTVRINNSPVNVGDNLNGAVVIVLQSPKVRYPTSITAEVSHPEVIL